VQCVQCAHGTLPAAQERSSKQPQALALQKPSCCPVALPCWAATAAASISAVYYNIRGQQQPQSSSGNKAFTEHMLSLLLNRHTTTTTTLPAYTV
jgi:hypothetical protein